MDYVSYSKNAFLNLKEEYKEQGFALYQPKDDENIVMYVTRSGLVHIWRNNAETAVVSITCITMKSPSLLTEETFDELIKIAAKRKHWRGGIHKLRHYLRHIGEVLLDEEGIDPYFYAWMVQYNVGCTQVSDCDYFLCFNDILDENRFRGISILADTIGDKVENLAKEYVVKHGNDADYDYNRFVSDVLKRNTLYQKVRELVDAELPKNAPEKTREGLALNICTMIKSTESAVKREDSK